MLFSSGTCCGRFAPSPPGPLHFGSLVAAVGSYLDARSVNGRWLVRIEDLDPPREIAGASDDILRTLERFGLYWDGSVRYQSQHQAAYDQAIDTLELQGLTYPCSCSRRDIQAAGANSSIYPGTCRNGLPTGRKPRSLRLRVDNHHINFTDRLSGPSCQALAEQVGDFILRRADGLIAYQLAVVVDDAAQGITDVVRGHDLFDNTARQIYLQRCLGLPTPNYLHLPVVCWPNGSKYSKQTRAPSISAQSPSRLLAQALCFLGQPVPAGLADETLDTFWQWAISAWDSRRIPTQASIPFNPETSRTSVLPAR